MKYQLPFFLVLIIAFSTATQNAVAQDSDNQIISVADQMPEFPGGNLKMFEFISQHIQYPTQARKDGIEGTVYVGFIVRKDGSITDVKTIKGVREDLDMEAERIIKIFPKWIPGTVKDENVNVRYALPIKYRLNRETKKK